MTAMTKLNRSAQIPLYDFVGIKQYHLFHTLKHPQFTGELIFTSLNKLEEWTFYIYFGRIIYATGGIHSTRRWLRNVKKIAPHLLPQCSKIKAPLLTNRLFSQYWEYESLIYWLNRGVVNRHDFTEIVRNIVVEILFDVTQEMKIAFQLSENQHLSNPLVFINPDQVIREASTTWQKWQRDQLTHISPNYSPVIVEEEQLKQYTSRKNYQIMSKFFNGQHTIRDLSLQLHPDIISLNRSILPYLEMGLIKLISVPDLVCPIQL